MDLEKNKIMMIVIIVLLLVLIGTIAGVSVYAISLINKSSSEAQVNVNSNLQPKELTQNDVVLVEVDDAISTDLLTGLDNKQRAIRLNVSISVDNTDVENSENLVTLLSERKVVIQDIVLSTVRRKTYDDLKGEDKDAMEILRNEILEKLRAEFNTNLIAYVYISNIVLQ